jgi:GNAT superfamily N-acetyltransferase
MNLQVAVAQKEDIPALVKLVNSAFRGESSKKGWTHEADLLHGEVRIDEITMAQQFDDENAVTLKCTTADIIKGCVYLKKQKEKVYLGMLTVDPSSQGEGIGKMLLIASEDWALQQGYHIVCMTVIALRTDIIDWYVRHGYKKTGRTKPFAVDEKFGVPVQPLFFEVLEKELV